MRTKLKLDICHGIPPIFGPDDWVAFDLEIYGMTGRLHRPSGTFACLTACPDGKTVYYMDNDIYVSAALEAASISTWVLHNASFDLTHLRRWATVQPREKLWDTLLIDRILWNGWFDTFSLKDLSRRYLRLYMEKETRNEFIERTSMTEEMIFYACQDCAATWRASQIQRDLVSKSDLKCWNKIDKPALWATLDFKGFKVDVPKWKQAAEENTQAAAELKASFSFNPQSPKQVKDYFLSRGISLKSTDEENLSRLEDETAAAILRFRKIAKRASTYGENWVLKYIEADERVYSDWNIIGAETGRMSSSEPNLQNIPVRETPIYRECFIPGEGNILVIADFGQQEPRCLAYMSGDAKLKEIFAKGLDIYCEIGREVFDEEIKKDDPRRKNILKPLVLAISYGMAAESVARDTGLTVEEAQALLDKFFERFQGVAEYTRKQQRCGDYVTTSLGRKSWINKYNEQWSRNVLNTPIQGSASEITKRALALIHQDWNHERWGAFGIVAVIHDEFVAEVPAQYGAEVAKFIVDRMCKAAHSIIPGIPATVDFFVGDSWAEKH